jgi:hypothetical protein
MGSDWAVAIAVASIAFAFAIYYTATAWFEHRERMAQIEMGVDPSQLKKPLKQSATSSVESDIVPLLDLGLSVQDIERLLKQTPGADPVSVESDIVPLIEHGVSVDEIERLLKLRNPGPKGSVSAERGAQPG